ncbi:MAG: phosphoenolpyruvate carboxylase [Alphaproteobacteria bacterium]|nr:phosphoenolpyruvate carboxylase [Alphaproteobacteria bacterium]
MTSIRREKLTSSSHYDVAATLSDALIDEVRSDETLGGDKVANALEKVADVIWSPLKKGMMAFGEENEQKNSAVFAQVIDDLKDDATRRNFLESYARLGHLYEVASLVARENTITRELDGFAPGGVREFVSSCDSAQQAADALSKPVFEMVMTAHPTNVNTLDSIKAQRKLGQAIDKVRDEEEESTALVADALRNFIHTPILAAEQGEMENLTVQDETETTLYYLCNIYDDLPSVYGSMDDALQRKGEYDPLSLNLHLQFGSWGSSGDKDGNMQVNADTTLDAIARHKCAILDRYTTSLQDMQIDSLSPWLEVIDDARQKTAALQQRIIEKSSEGGIDPLKFSALSKELAECTLDAKVFEQAAVEAYEQTNRDDALNLVRRIRIFGGSFAKIEYRENAEEYTRVVGELIEGYEEQSLDARTETLTQLLQEPEKLAELYKQAKPRLEEEGVGKPYDTNNAAPIAYQTLKRMELARDFPGVIKDNVLAEFTHPSQLLEAVALQAAVAEDGKRATLGVVPLFESPESMTEAPAIMDSAYKNPAYCEHMKKIADRDGLDQPVQQIQIAHSDNARRSGLPAARAYIHDAHHNLRDTAKENGVNVQFFEGGSSSDIYRGGVRATSSAVRAYGLQDFAKFTFQGGDMLNYMNYAPSSKRLFVRNFSNSASHQVHGGELSSNITWCERERGPRIMAKDPVMAHKADTVVSKALKGTLDDYRDHAFTRAGLGHLLRALEYDEEKLAGTAGSRAPVRAQQAPSGNAAEITAEVKEPAASKLRVEFAKVNSTQMAPAETVDIHKTRTITFSEALQHGGLVPTIVGSRTIEKNLHREVNAMRTEINEKSESGKKLSAGEKALLKCYEPGAGKDAPLPAQAIRFMFKQSKLMQDVTIRLAIGVALTDFDGMRNHHPHLRQDPFLDQLEDECREAANIVCAAFTGKYPESLVPGKKGREGFDEIPTSQLRHLMVARFPEMQQVLEDKSRYLGFLQALKADARESTANGDEGMDAYSRRLTHAAGDTVTHGRMVPTSATSGSRTVGPARSTM